MFPLGTLIIVFVDGRRSHNFWMFLSLFSTVTLPLTEYLIEIQINSVDSSVTDQLRTLLMSFNLPYIISDSTNITEISITTGTSSVSAL